MVRKSNELDFTGQDVYIGIDVHLKSWTVCIMTDHLVHKRFTLPPSAEALFAYLLQRFPGATYHSAYEAGFSGFWAHRQLVKVGIRNIVTNPADVPTGQKERVEKDDPVDSRKIARSLRSGDLVAIYVPSEATLEERGLVRMRATMVKDMTRLKARVKSFLYFFGVQYPDRFSHVKGHWSKKFIRWLKEEVNVSQASGKQILDLLVIEVEALRKLLLDVMLKIKVVASSEKYASDVELLLSVPGIGFLTAITLLTEIETIERFSDTDHFAGYVGLVPKRRYSGETKNDGEITFRGQKVLKKCIIESAFRQAQ